MAKPCAVFWDIENIDVPKGKSVASIVNQIRSTIIKPYNLSEIFFFCVCDVHRLPKSVGQSLKKLDIDIVQAYKGKDSADMKIMDLMRKFVKVAGQDCTIILLSGDSDYYGTLNELKKLHNVSIHLIRLANSCSPKLDQISDYTFMLNDGVLKPVKSTGNPMYFISIKNYPLTLDINQVMSELNAQATGSIENSAILYDSSICIGFPTLWNAERAIEQLNESRYHGHFLKVELVVDSPLSEILKCIKPVQTKSNNEVKQLAFIKMNNSNEADISKFIKFCITCTAQSGSQCILSRKSFFWIVFSCNSDAQNFLPKVQIMYPDSIISEPPIDLNLTSHENPYTVESCKQIVPNETSSDSGADSSNIAIVQPDRTMQVNSQQQSSSIAHVAGIRLSVDIEPESSKESVTTSVEPQNIINLDARGDKDWKIFFRCDHSFVTLMLYYQPTKWSLLYNLFEKLYDLGAKKVIFDGNIYCAHFDSASAYHEAFTEKRSRYLEHLEVVNVPLMHEHEVKKKMNQYITGIPWCLNQELDLCCLVVKIESKLHDEFIEMCKNVLGNRECIFIKSSRRKIWMGFPDELICKNSKKTVIRLLADLPQTNVSMAKPSNALLESINFPDLVGDAYDLAFLSSQLENSKPITRPRIIQQISLKRVQEQKFNEALFHITVKGDFFNLRPWVELTPKQIVKIFVKFSKVIPLAATASYFAVNLIYNSWYEAHTSRHFLDKLTLAEVPYFSELHKASEVKRQQITCYDFFEYYIINDKRKVLEKIIQNKNQVDELESNSSKVQSTSDIDVLDREMMKKLKYLFTISTNSGFKFTSEMISIITMNLVQMDCPACIEFQDKIWVGVDDLEKGNKVKARFRYLNFKMLHENDEDDFDVGIVMQLAPSIPTKIAKVLANKLMKTTEVPSANVPLITQAVPLGHFNYNYRKAVGMSISRYCQSYESVRY